VRCFDHETPVTLELDFDIGQIRERFDPAENGRRDIWRYRDLFPVAGETPVTLGEGWTDLVDADELGGRLDVDLSLKLEGGNPTGSAKDRGSSVLVTHAREQGYDGVACASTGNAAASVSAYAARGGRDCSIFVPGSLPRAKGVQSRIYGAEVVTVDGEYEQAHEVCQTRVQQQGWLDRSAGSTPHVPAGERTLGYELAEQTSRVPDWVVVPVGNGGTLAGAFEGWRTFERLGHAERTPRFLGVQSRSACPIHESLTEDTERRESRPDGDSTASGDAPAAGETDTCADSIDVSTPQRTAAVRAALAESNGATVAVSDEAIRTWMRELGSVEGVFAEPASAATLAGLTLARERGLVAPGSNVVAVITGSGLKDIETANTAIHGEPNRSTGAE
jgi:threonine synthase